MSSFISNKAQKRESSTIHGRGLFAIENISKGEIVSIKGGHILTYEQLHNSRDGTQNTIFYTSSASVAYLK